MINHDRLFKELLQAFFCEFIDLFLPEVAAYLDRTSVGFVDKEVFTDATAASGAKLIWWRKFASRTPTPAFSFIPKRRLSTQKDFPRRLFIYFARLHEKYNLPVYPIVLFSFARPGKAQPEQYIVSFPDREVMHFNYAVIQLNRLSWRKYVKQSNPVAAALMAKMAIAAKDRAHVKLECLRLMTTLSLNPAQEHLLSVFIDTYLDLTAREMEQYKREKGTLSQPEQEAIMERETSWMREGRQLGREEGRNEGLQLGMVTLVCRQLKHRLGILEPSIIDQVQALNSEQLEELSEALLDFSAVADLERWLRSKRNKKA
jgi:hypothetical protein